MPLQFTSADDLARSLMRAGAAHGAYEEKLGQGRDENWPAWYAAHMEREQPKPEAGSASPEISFADADQLAQSLLRAEAAHGQHEKDVGHAEPDWPRWYAEYLEGEQS